MGGDGTGGLFGRGCAPGTGGHGLGPQLRRVGIEAQNHLGLAQCDVAGQPVSEWNPGRPRPVDRLRDQLPLTAFLRPEPAENFGAFEAAIWIRSPVCGLTP